jgi:hypothetical protein
VSLSSITRVLVALVAATLLMSVSADAASASRNRNRALIRGPVTGGLYDYLNQRGIPSRNFVEAWLFASMFIHTNPKTADDVAEQLRREGFVCRKAEAIQCRQRIARWEAIEVIVEGDPPNISLLARMR